MQVAFLKPPEVSPFRMPLYRPRFSRLIDDFNKIITNSSFRDRLNSCLDELSADDSFEGKDIEKLEKAVHDEFMPIEAQHFG